MVLGPNGGGGGGERICWDTYMYSLDIPLHIIYMNVSEP